LVATLLGSVLVPYVNRRIDAEKRVQALKSESATTILRAARDVDRKLNLVTTAFGNFYQDQIAPRRATKESTVQFRTQIYKLYEDFDRDAWWWHWQALEEGQLLGVLTNETRADFERAVGGYQRNLIACTETLNPVWEATVRIQTPTTTDALNQSMQVMFTRMHELSPQRQQFVREMVRAVLR
jgi:hypothetical protein